MNRTLAILNYGGLAISVLLILTTLFGTSKVKRLSLWIERILLVILAGVCAVGQFVIAFWLMSIRIQLGRPIDEVAMDDPLRVQFNTLHEYSRWALFAGMVAALIAFLVIANRKDAKGKSNVTDFYDFQKEFKV